MSVSTVFVVQEVPNKNIDPAKKYGNIRVMLSIADVQRGTVFCANKLRIALQDYQLGDFLLPIGDPVLIGIAIHCILLQDQGAPFDVLRWVREEYTYRKQTIIV